MTENSKPRATIEAPNSADGAATNVPLAEEPRHKKAEPLRGKRGQFQLFITEHRRALVAVGAVTMLATYFAKDIAVDDVKDDIARAYAIGPQQQMLREWELTELQQLAAIEEQLNIKDASAIDREHVMNMLAEEILRAQQITMLQYTVAKSLPDVTLDLLKDIRHVHELTGEVSTRPIRPLDAPPPEPAEFRIEAMALKRKLAFLSDETGKVSARLQRHAVTAVAELEQRSKRYTHLITGLYLVGWALTIVSSLYKLDLPGGT